MKPLESCTHSCPIAQKIRDMTLKPVAIKHSQVAARLFSHLSINFEYLGIIFRAKIINLSPSYVIARDDCVTRKF